MSTSAKSNPLANFKLWYYTPSLPAAIIATIVFACLTTYHSWRLIRTRTWFCIPFFVGGLFETTGYAARAAAHSDMTGLAPYIMQSLLLLLAPILFAASIYMILSRIIRATKAEEHSIIRVTWLTRIFVGSDVTCFMIQSSGGGLQAIGTASAFKLGQHIVLGGLILQIMMFTVFVIVATVFHSRLRRVPTLQSLDPNVPWERLMWILYAVSLLIVTRNVVRTVEYGMGATGYLLTHEWTLYVFDGLLMATALLLCVTWYNSTLRPRSKSLESNELEQYHAAPKLSARI